MKNQILRNFILSALVAAPLYAELGSYNKKNMRPFFTLSTDYRMLVQPDDINKTIFLQGYSGPEGTSVIFPKNYVSPYNLFTHFDDHMGPYINIGSGVQLNQLEIGINFGVTLPQTSKPKKDYETFNTFDEKDSTITTYSFLLWDAKYFMSTVDFKFSYLIFPETSPINIVPSISVGWSFLHMQFGGQFPEYKKDETDPNLAPLTYRKGYYSTGSNSITLTPEIEVRMNLSNKLTLGMYGGYRPFDFEDVVTESDGDRFFTNNVGGGSADTYYAGLRASWYLLSTQQKEDAVRE